MDDDALPRVKKPTKAEQAVIDAEQAEMAVRFNASGRKFDRAYAIIKEMNEIPREDWGQRQFGYYVDALVELGEYDTAYELTKDKKYKKIWDAINGKVLKECKCRDWESTEMVEGKPTLVKHTRFFVKQEIWNVKTGKTANLVACNVCGRAFVQ